MKRLLLAAGLLLGACATEPGTTGAETTANRDCFRQESVTGYNLVDARTLKLNVGPGRDYLLTTNRSLNELRGYEQIAVRSTPSGLICTGNGLGVQIYGGDTMMPWVVTSISRVPEEIVPEGS